MILSILCLMLAWHPSPSSQTLVDEEYFSHLTVDTYDVPGNIFKDKNSFTVSGAFTLSQSDDISSLDTYLTEELVSNGLGFISVKVRYNSGDHSEGTLELTFPALPDEVNSRTVVLEYGTGDPCTIVQTRTQNLGYSIDPAGQSYPTDERYITVTGGTKGVRYIMFRDDTDIHDNGFICDGGPMVFGPYSECGYYQVYNTVTGYSLNGISLEHYNIFMIDEFIMSQCADANQIDVPYGGGVYTVTVVSTRDLDPSLYQSIADRMNTGGLPGWKTNDGTVIEMGVRSGNTLDITFRCAPNFSSVTKTHDTGFYISENSVTFKVVQTGNANGSLNTYTLQGTWTDRAGGLFTMSLSGSQPGVTYTLTRDGYSVKSVVGDGGSLDFGVFSGYDGAFGSYYVLAQYSGKTSQGNTVTMTISGVPSGNNYTASRTYLDSGASSSVVDVTYYNGLGLPIQSIAQKAAGDGTYNIVKPIVYDNMLRGDTREYLPFRSYTTAVSFNSAVLDETLEFYDGIDEFPYRDRTYESGVSGRLKSVCREGYLYHENGIVSKLDYSVENGNGQILKLRYRYPSGETAAGVLADGFWEADNLSVTRTISEDNDTSFVYGDVTGRTLMSRAVNGGRNLDTYYVYDLRDSLVCVIQPEGVPMIGSGFDLGGELAQKYCFTWKRDAWGNVTESHTPGSGTIQKVYDARNRLVLHSGSELRGNGRWMYVTYDALDRVTEEGTCTPATDLATLRTSMYSGLELGSMVSGRQPSRKVTYWASGTSTSEFMPVAGVTTGSDLCVTNCLTMPYKETLYQTSGATGFSSGATERFYFYDYMGRLIQTVVKHPDGSKSVHSTKYDFTGNALATVESHTSGGVTDRFECRYTYDDRGRVKTLGRIVCGVTLPSIAYSYDDLGRLASREAGGRGGDSYGYNLQGWQENFLVEMYDHEVFSQSLSYYAPFGSDAVPSCTGKVSESVSSHRNRTARSEWYGYDHLGRLTGNGSSQGSVRNLNIETGIRYSDNGNITALRRVTNNEDKSLIFTHYGNRLASMTGGTASTFAYDSDGRLVSDSGRGLSLSYNALGLTDKVTSGGVDLARYSYLSDGTKVKTMMSDGRALEYRGGFVYSVSAGGARTLESIASPVGRIIARGSGSGRTFRDLWFVRDRLGSVRAVVDITDENADVDSAVLEESDYMPFGTRFTDSTAAPTDTDNRYRFAGKEEQAFAGLPYLDFGARLYDPATARWNASDPMAEKYTSISPFAYCLNNPINLVDIYGLEPWSIENVWSDDFINKFKEFLNSIAISYQNINTKLTCEDFALSVLIDFAAENGLPLTIVNGTGTYSTSSDKYSDKETFKNDILKTTAARDLQRNENTTEVYSQIIGKNISSLSNIEAGDVILFRDRTIHANHVQVVASNADHDGNISIIQGNSNILLRFHLGSGNPQKWNYYGKNIERGNWNIITNTYQNLTTGKIQSNYSTTHNIQVRRFNYKQF